MIKVRTPDGAVVQFPDSMSMDEIAGVMRKRFGGPEGAKAEERIAGAFEAAADQPLSKRDTMLAATGGAIEGIPIAGPYLREGLNKAGALKRSLLSGNEYEDELQNLRTKQEWLAQDRPLTTIAGNVGGAVASMVPLGATAAGARVLGITGRNLGTRSLAGGTSGASINAMDAAVRSDGDPEAIKRAAAYGLGMGGAAPMVGNIVGATGRALLGTGRGAPAPALDAMRAAKQGAYQKVDSLGGVYTPSSLSVMAKTIAAQAKKAKINPKRHERAVSMIEDIEEAAKRPMTLTELDQLRQIVRRDVIDPGDDAEEFFGDQIVAGIDKFIESAKPVGGSAKANNAAIKQARLLNTRYRKAELIEDALSRAARRAARTGSGGNVENTIRQNIDGILNSPSKVAAFSKAERKLMEEIVSGARGQNLARLIGKLSPSGNGLMAALGLGATVANPLYAIGPAAGIMGKTVAEGMAKNQVKALEKAVRTGIAPPIQPSISSPATQLLLQGGPLGYRASDLRAR